MRFFPSILLPSLLLCSCQRNVETFTLREARAYLKNATAVSLTYP